MVHILLKGTPASLGSVKAKVRILRDPTEASNLRKGEILVVEMTDPLYMPAIMKSAGIITNIGGQLSHAAIVAREFRIPCIVNTHNATDILKNGQTVILDATAGEVRNE